MTLAIVLIVICLVASSAVGFVVWRIRTNAREKKNYERALKLVPLLIHLPPMSEDIEGNGRDSRDVVDENISRAQVIYNIIGSTVQKGFKTRLYGQRHFSFEIVGTQGLVYFYAMVPVALVDVVKQAIVSAYTSAQVEEATEHNIFNQVGKLTGVMGGEFELKKDFAYPIATYQDLKRDSMQGLLNSLSTLDKEDGACIQILMRPADSKWQSQSTSLSQDVRKGKKNKSLLQHIGNWSRQIAVAFVRPPNAAGDKKDDKPQLSNLEQSTLEAVDDKTRYQGYETLIRVVVSSNISQRAQTILSNISAAFSLFDAPGRNGFKYAPAAQSHELIHDYLLRLFPQQNNKMVLNSVELATLFHFPDQRSIPTSQLKRQESKQVDAPRNMPNDGLLLGYNIFRGAKKPIRLALQDRQRHMYVVGQTGTGKSTFLENLALQDMLSGGGFAFVDPHGDTAERLLAMVPKERTEDVIYFSPGDMQHPMGVNIFEFETPDQKDFLIQEALNMLYKLYDPQHTGIMGPRYENLFRNAALTIMADPAGGTFIDIPKLFRDPKFVQQKLKYVSDPNVREFWEKEMPQAQRSNEFGDVVSWFVSKFGAFLTNDMMRNIIGQNKSSFNMREIMDNHKILLVNLSKGRTGELNSKLLGMFFVMKFQAAAMSRANISEVERKDFALYVDEFQNFSTDSFATILSEARKYHLNLIVANQYTRQLSEEIRDAVFGNVGTVVAFRVGNDDDAEVIAKRMQPAFSASDLLRVPNFNTVTRTLINGVPTLPFSMATLPPLGSPNEKLADALKQLSAAKYGRPKQVVEEEIFERMKTQEPPKSAVGMGPTSGYSARQPWAAPAPAPYGSFGGPSGFGTSPSSGVPSVSPAAPVPKAGASFLDDWLAKRQTPGGHAAQPGSLTPAAKAFGSPAPTPDASTMNGLGGVPASDAPSSLQIPQSKPATQPQDATLELQSNTNSEGHIIIKPDPAPGGSASAKGPSHDQSDTIYIDQQGTVHPTINPSEQ